MAVEDPKGEPLPGEIWMINHYAITPDLPGGTRHYDFGCELKKAGFTVRIFASDVNHALRRHVKLKDRRLWTVESVNGVDFIWVRTADYQRNDWRRAWNMLSFAFNVLRVGFRVKGFPHAIIGSSPHLFAALSAWWLAKRKGASFILELRDLWPQALVDMGLPESSIMVRLLRIIEKFLYTVADKIIILAHGSYSYLVNRGVTPGKIVYIPNGVHLGNFRLDNHQKTRLQARARFGFTRFTVVYTGAHGPANALETILGAADLLRGRNDVEFVLVGDGQVKDELLRKAAGLKLENVRFLPPVPKNEVPELLAAADAAVITLRAVDAFSYGVSPNKLFDYMAACKPVICAIPGEMTWLVEQNKAGMTVEAENPGAIASAVEQILAMNEEERAAMGRRGRALIEREFSREILAKRLLECLGCL